MFFFHVNIFISSYQLSTYLMNLSTCILYIRHAVYTSDTLYFKSNMYKGKSWHAEFRTCIQVQSTRADRQVDLMLQGHARMVGGASRPDMCCWRSCLYDSETLAVKRAIPVFLWFTRDEKAQVLVPSTPRKKWEEKAFKAAFINHCHCPLHRSVDYIPDGMGSVNARAIRAINVGAELIGDYGDDYVFEPHCACCWPVGGSCRWCEP